MRGDGSVSSPPSLRSPFRARHPWVRWHSRLHKWTAEVRLGGRVTFLGHCRHHSDAVVAVNVWLGETYGSMAEAWGQRKRRRRRLRSITSYRPELDAGPTEAPQAPQAPAPASLPSLPPPDERSLLAELERLEEEQGDESDE